MAKELNEDTAFKMSVKTMGMVAVGIFTLVGGWYSLMQEIQIAKEQPVQIDVNILKSEILDAIPEAEITRMEFDMKDQNIRLSIENTEKAVEELKITLRRMEDKIEKLR